MDPLPVGSQVARRFPARYLASVLKGGTVQADVAARMKSRRSSTRVHATDRDGGGARLRSCGTLCATLTLPVREASPWNMNLSRISAVVRS